MASTRTLTTRTKGSKGGKGGKGGKGSKGRKGSKGSVKIVIKHPGVLGAFGYHDVKHLSTAKRRAALRMASRVLGWLYLIRKLNALYVFNKYRNPQVAALFLTDRQYASARHAAEKS